MPSILNDSVSKVKSLFQKPWEWRIGVALIAGFLLARGLGLFSSLELTTLDFFLRHRPPEKEDNHIVIVLVDEAQFQTDQTSAEKYLADLVEIILVNKPTVVGLNIFMREPDDYAARSRLISLFKNYDNLIGVQKVFPPEETLPPEEILETTTEKQFGINDVPLDRDSKIRRVFVGSYLPDGTPETSNDNPFVFSFSFLVAEKYLADRGYSLENHPRDPASTSFKYERTQTYTKIPRLEPNHGGYIREDNIADLQTLLNFRARTNTFRILKAQDILNGDINPNYLTRKAVIVGSMDPSLSKLLPVSAFSSLSLEGGEDVQLTLPRLGILGTELEAHAASQIINAVIENRPLIDVIPPFFEIVLIAASGITGVLIGNTSKSKQATLQNTSLLATAIIFIIASSYLLLCFTGIWLPVVPASSIMAITGITYIAFYQSERFSSIETRRIEKEALRLEEEALRLEEERRKTIDKIFNSIHAGPLQTLAGLLRNARDGKLEQERLTKDLESLNKEIRGIGERLRQEAIEDVYFIDTQQGIKIDLMHPMHEVFYEVYSVCVKKDLPGFQDVKVRSVAFEPFDCKSLDLETKQELCWFLQESLENVGKHATGTVRLIVTGRNSEELYTLCVEDNGTGIQSSHVGEGTHFFHRLEEKLQGEFRRTSKPSGGTVCKLAWPIAGDRKSLFQLRQENPDNIYFEGSRYGTKLDLTRPLHTLFYEICHSYLQEDLPGFQNIETCSFSFEPFNCAQLTLGIRRKLCCCLQESLENVGRHAPGTTRLLVIGTLLDGFYTLSVEDNGPGIASSHIGEGTRLFSQLEKLLGGTFSRTISPAGGTVCELKWPLHNFDVKFMRDPDFYADQLSLW